MREEGEIMNVRGVASGPLFGPEYGTELYTATVKSTSPYMTDTTNYRYIQYTMAERVYDATTE